MKDPAILNGILAAAMRQASEGHYQDALRTLKSKGEIALGHPVGRNIQGGILLAQGKLDEALGVFDRAILSARSFPEAHCNRGVALQRLGRLDEALQALDTALGSRRDYPMAHFNRGNVLKSLGRFDEAIAAFSVAIRQKTDFAEAYLNRGLTHLRQRYFVGALEDADRVLRLRPAQPDAVILKATALTELGRASEALAALSGIPESPTERIARASALRQLGRYEEALEVADSAVRFDPAMPEGHSIRGVVLGDLLRVDEQLAAFRSAIALAEEEPRHRHSLAVALSEAGRAAEARAAYAEAIRLAPEDPAMRYHASLIRLYLGDLEGGFEEHEWRLKTRDFHGAKHAGLAPAWKGEAIAGKSLLVYPEQGLGDAIQFLRYLPRIAEKGARVGLFVPAALRTIAASSFPGVEMIADPAAHSGFDYQVSLLSLAHVFRTRLDRVPANVPYLATDPARVDKWRERIGKDGFRVGIAWQGNTTLPADRFRSVDPVQFAPLAAIPGVRLISIQAIHGLEKLEGLSESLGIESFGDEIGRNPEGIAEIAALMANLDLVVSVDSATAHLAGALARPAWVAIRRQPEWRWMERRSDSPWYPTMRLFRQKEALAWGEVFETMAAELARLMASGDAGG